MKIYTDVFSNQQIISDSYPMEELFDGVAVEVQTRMIIKGQEKIDVGNCNHFGGAEQEAGQNGGDQPAKVNDVVDAFHYESTTFDKAGFQVYFKQYMKKIKGYLEENRKDRVEKFLSGAKDLFKWILKNFDDFQFYCPQSFDMENHIVLSYYKKQDADAPTFIFIMDGLKFYKV